MAEIQPFKGWRYNEDFNSKIEELTSPLFDVVSSKQREKLYKNPNSSIHLSVPAGEHPAQEAKSTLEQWKKEGIIKQDALPGIYIYYQYFNLPGSLNEFCRKGFICNIRIHHFEEKVILRHENTIPVSVNDRQEMLETTQLHVSPTHGLYSDVLFELEHFMDDAMLNPIYETEDYQGVRDVLAVIHDYEIIKKFVSVLSDKTIILADGHHRYQGSLSNMEKQKEANPQHTGNEAYNFHMMYLTNMESDHLRIMPTHRLIKEVEDFSEEKIMEAIEPYFTIKPVEDAFTINEVIYGKKWAFGLLFKDNAYKIRLKPEMIDQISWPFPDIIKHLDLTILHYFLLEKVFHIKGKDQRSASNVSYDRSFSDCFAKVLKNEAQLAIIVNEISVQDVKKVCDSGFTLPQKSTYFYPKVISGFVFSSIKEDEFPLPNSLRF